MLHFFSCDLKWFLNNPVISRMIFNTLHRKRGDPTLDLHNNYLINWNEWLELSMEYSFQNGEVRRLLPSTSLDGHPGQVIVHPQPPPSGIWHGQSSLSNRQLFWHRQLCASTRRHFWHSQSYRSIRRYFWLTRNRFFSHSRLSFALPLVYWELPA